MTWRDIYDIAMGVGLPGLVVWYVRDRKKTLAAGRLAEGSVGPEIAKREIGTFDIHVAYIERAFAAERASFIRQIDKCQEQIEKLTGEVRQRDERVEEMKVQMRTMKLQITDMSAKLARINTEPEGA